MHSVLRFGFVNVFKTKLFPFGEDGSEIKNVLVKLDFLVVNVSVLETVIEAFLDSDIT